MLIGATIAVRKWSCISAGDTTKQGRVFLTSLPTVGDHVKTYFLIFGPTGDDGVVADRGRPRYCDARTGRIGTRRGCQGRVPPWRSTTDLDLSPGRPARRPAQLVPGSVAGSLGGLFGQTRFADSAGSPSVAVAGEHPRGKPDRSIAGRDHRLRQRWKMALHAGLLHCFWRSTWSTSEEEVMAQGLCQRRGRNPR